MKRILVATLFGALPFTALAQQADEVTYACRIDENCSAGICKPNSPPFEFKVIHNLNSRTGLIKLGDREAETIHVGGMGSEDFMQLGDDSSVGFSIRTDGGDLEVRAHGPAGSTLEKGTCEVEG